MHRSNLCCLLLLLLVMAGNAQSIKKRALQADTGKLYLRFNPLGVFDYFDGNITPGAEYRFNDTWTATLDAGAVLYSGYFGRARSSLGFLIRPGIRVYPGKYKDYFVELQLHYKNVTYRINDWLEKEVVSNVPSYEERKVFQYKKQVMGARIMVGKRESFTKSKRWYWEIYAGLGIHFKTEGLHNEPNSHYDVYIRIINTFNGSYTMLAVPAGIRLAYLIR